MISKTLSGFMCLAALSLAGCKDATQVTFDISTNLPCAQVNGVSVTVGTDSATDKSIPVLVTHECTDNGSTALIGSYVVTPQTSKSTTAFLKVALAVGNGIDVESDCTDAKAYKGCIVARRFTTFVTSKNVTIPVQLLDVCKGVGCDATTSCNDTGTCAP